MVTAVLFSATLTVAVAPPPFEVMTGASFALVTVTAIACVSASVPSRHLHDDVVDVVGAGIGRRLEVRRRDEAQRAGRALMVNLRRVGAAADRIGQRRAGIGVGRPTTVVTAVLFSATLTVAVAPPPFEVMTGASFALVTVTAIAWVSVSVPSETCT